MPHRFIRTCLALFVFLSCSLLTSESLAAGKVELHEGELPIRQPWLRDHLPEDSLAYVRVPHLFGWLATPKGNVMDEALRSKANVANLEKIREGFTNNVLPHIPAFANVQLRLLEEHLRSPIEMAFFLADAPSVLVSVNVDVDSHEALAEMFELMGVPLLEPLDESGVGQLGVVPVPVFLRFDATSGQLLMLGGTTVNSPMFNEILVATERQGPHAMAAMEGQIDTSGQGLFMWMNAQQVIPLLEAVLPPDEAEVWAASGLSEVSSFATGWGVANGKGRISFVADLPSDAERGFLPIVSNDIEATSVGVPDGIFVMSIPSAEEYSRLEALALDTASAETQASWGEGKALFADATGIAVEEIFSAIGPDLMIIADQAGDYTAVRVRDSKLWNNMLKRMSKKTGEPFDKRKIDGKTYYHVEVPNEFALLSEEEAGEMGWFAVLFARQRDHVYWVEEGDYLYIASTPQILIDRSNMSERTHLGRWMQDSQRIDSSSAIFSFNGTGRKLPARLYATYITILHLLADVGDTDIDVWSMPTARQLELPERGTLGFTLSLGDPTIAMELVFENNPGEFLGGVGGIAMVGVLAAVAVPAYQDYMIRAQVSAGLTIGSSLKLEITQFYQENGRFPNADEAAEMSIYEADSEHVVSVIVEPDTGLVIIQFAETVNGGGELYLEVESIDDGVLEWVCSATYDDKHLPQLCRVDGLEYDEESS